MRASRTRCKAPRRWLRRDALVVLGATSWRTRSTTDLRREEAYTATPLRSRSRRSARVLVRELALSKRGDVNCITLPLPPSNARRRADAPVLTVTSAANVRITSSPAFVDSRNDRAREVASGWCILDIAPSTRRWEKKPMKCSPGRTSSERFKPCWITVTPVLALPPDSVHVETGPASTLENAKIYLENAHSRNSKIIKARSRCLIGRAIDHVVCCIRRSLKKRVW